MSIRYFAWKDGKKETAKKQQWEELSAKDFKAIYESNKKKEISKRRFFIRLSGVEYGDDIFLFESDYVDFKKYRSEKERAARKKKKLKEYEKEYGEIEVLSLDAELENSGREVVTLHSFVSDDGVLFEDRLTLSMAMEAAMNCLSIDEYNLIYATIVCDEPKSLREYADETGVPFTTLASRRKKALEKMKRFFVQN